MAKTDGTLQDQVNKNKQQHNALAEEYRLLPKDSERRKEIEAEWVRLEALRADLRKKIND